MSISFGGIGSGLPTQDWITAILTAESAPLDGYYADKSELSTQKTTLTIVEGKFSQLRSAVEKLTDSNIISSFDLFGRRSVTSSDSSIATASVSNSASSQEVKLKVNSLATSTVATSTTDPGARVTEDTKITDLGNGSAKGGTFSIFVDNTKYEYEIADADADDEDEITESDSIKDLIDKINADFSNGEVVASLTADGKFKIDVDKNQVEDFMLGSSTDTSNFLNIAQLQRVAVNPDNPMTPDNIDEVISSNSLSSINTSETLVGNAANLTTEVTAGTFTIGDAEFTIDEETNLNDLIAKINSKEDAGVTVSFDSRSNELKIVSNDPGALAINIEAGTSNFTEVMGLTNGNKIADDSQVIGNNANIELNGNNIEAYSNTISSDITGISGLTINLLGTTSEENGETSEVSINVQQNTDDLVNAVDSFITKFNLMVSEVDKNTGINGSLHSEYTLINSKNNLRSITTGMIEGIDKYNNVSMIGITTGDIGTDIKNSANSLQLDKTKFLEALADNPDDVRALLIGDEDRGITGIMQKLETSLESSLDPEYGYFAAREDSLDSQSSSLDTTIKNFENKLDARQLALETQFAAMDKAISEMQSQASYMMF